MKKIEADDPEACSADLMAENLGRLKEFFPEAFTEGEVDFDVLRQLLGDVVDDGVEKYGLNWHGKRQARQLALEPSAGTLRPCPDESVDWDTTQNLMIEGDNLEVLKLLQKSYSGKVKLIYIDPPYNTGKDFVYRDDYRDNMRNYLQITGQVDGARRLSSNVETSGRFHTDWLNMMYPRLKLARSLLRPDGAMFVTVDHRECSNLRLLLDEIFGDELRHCSSIAWKKRSSPDARATIGPVHDWILCYARNVDNIKSAIGKMPLTQARIKEYSNPDNDPRGDWASVDMTGMTGRATDDQYFDVVLPSGRTIGPPEGRSWGLAHETFRQLRADNRIWFGKTGDGVPRIKHFLSESDGQVVPSVWDMDVAGSNDAAKKEVRELFGHSDVFDTPKPVQLVRTMVEIATKRDDGSLVLDFFAGSGTTAHAVLEANQRDGGHRRCILVQLPEPLDPDTKRHRAAVEFCRRTRLSRNVASLTKERLRRAGRKIKEESPTYSGDLGFRVFRLDTSNIRSWNTRSGDLEADLLAAIDHIEQDRTEQDLLYELLLKLGLDLCTPIETQSIGGNRVHAVGSGALFACLGVGEEYEALAAGIADWHDELGADIESTVVFRDSAFADDVTKVNVTAILEQRGLSDVRSL